MFLSPKPKFDFVMEGRLVGMLSSWIWDYDSPLPLSLMAYK